MCKYVRFLYMAKRKKKQKRSFFDDLSPQTKQAIGAVAFVVLGIFFILSLMGMAGEHLGVWVKAALTYLFGAGAWLAPFICAFYVYALLNPTEEESVSTSKIIGIALMFLAALGMLSIYGTNTGGLIGLFIQYPLSYLMGTIAATISVAALLLIGIFLTFNVGLKLPGFLRKKEPEEEEFEEDFADLLPDEEETQEEDGEAEEEETEDEEEDQRESKRSLKQKLGFTKASDLVVSNFEGPYAPPPLSLLHKDKGKAKNGDVKASANIIKRTLKNFKIDVEMDTVEIGPTVTRYALKPAQGVKIARIVGLQKELELNLASGTIRIEAPIPGKSLVGIEVPNIEKATIGLASLLTSPEFTDSPKPLLVGLGKDIAGHPEFANIARMPHALIAGATNSGKSVAIQNLIISLLFRNSPDQLRFIMVDPKRVELTLYNGIPHLLTPVITDAKRAILSLKWAIKEMERRYDILQAEKVRDIASYHESIYEPAKEKWIENGQDEEEKDQLPEALPYIVIIIDELADLMTAYPRELEAAIVRLAQMSRAVGIHLILATQRPEVKVITGLIKANVPCRIALKVNSQIDSRTIIDTVGAEKLLGQGDMLFLSAERSKPLRLQSAFVTTEEIKKVVDYLKKQSDAQELDSINLDGGNADNNPDAFFESVADDGEEDDDLYEDAKQIILESGKASTSYLQRRLRIGYSRAARLMDILEDHGVIGPADGSKQREILIGRDGENSEEEQ